MKTVISEGPLKFLLIDTDAVSRNRNRGPHKQSPVGIVLVVEGGRIVGEHRSNDIEVKGAVALTYGQPSLLIGRVRDDMRAAYTTTAEVVVGEIAAPERAVQVPASAKAPPAPRPKPTKPARVTTVTTTDNTEESNGR